MGLHDDGLQLQRRRRGPAPPAKFRRLSARSGPPPPAPMTVGAEQIATVSTTDAAVSRGLAMMHHPSAVAIIQSHQQFNIAFRRGAGRAVVTAPAARDRGRERERRNRTRLVWSVLCICMYRAALARQCQSVSNPREVKRGPSNEIDRAAKITSGLGLCLWQAAGQYLASI